MSKPVNPIGIGHCGPVIVVHGNSLEHVTDAYKRFLEGRFRKEFKLIGSGGCITAASQTNSQLPGQEPATHPRTAGPTSTTPPKTSGGGMSAGAKIAIAAVVIGGAAGAAISEIVMK